MRRRQELVAVAEDVFFELGPSNVTMQAVAQRAGASKETLYRHFHNRDELFTEVVSNRTKRLVMPLAAALDRTGDLAEVLREFGNALLRLMMDPDVVALLRTIVAETPRRPMLGRIFYDAGPERARARLTECLAAADQRGEIRVRDPRLAATIFLGGVMSYAHAAGLVLVDLPPLTPSEVEERVDEVVSMFMQRYASR